MKKKKRFILLLLILILALPLAACASTDVIGKESVNSFEKILGALENNVAEYEENSGWALTSPDGSERFIWYTAESGSGTAYAALLEVDAQPFIDAGLDTAGLPDGYLVGDKIIAGGTLGEESQEFKSETPFAAFEKIVELYRERIKYHADLDHYGVDLGDGNMFEWAKDIGTNDKDIVFVLDPKVLTDAGVDPEKVEGWVFAKVKVMDEDGKPIEVDKFLKPFSIQE